MEFFADSISGRSPLLRGLQASLASLVGRGRETPACCGGADLKSTSSSAKVRGRSPGLAGLPLALASML